MLTGLIISLLLTLFLFEVFRHETSFVHVSGIVFGLEDRF